jgi:2-(3-amino-3-carboxypropyl)histidine synthase
MYTVDTDKIVKKIESSGAKRVLLQLPDGLKPQAVKIASELKKTGAEIIVWAGSNFGGCDVPTFVENIDLVVNVGHSEFPLKK